LYYDDFHFKYESLFHVVYFSFELKYFFYNEDYLYFSHYYEYILNTCMTFILDQWNTIFGFMNNFTDLILIWVVHVHYLLLEIFIFCDTCFTNILWNFIKLKKKNHVLQVFRKDWHEKLTSHYLKFNDI